MGFGDLFRKGYKYCGKALDCLGVKSGDTIEKILEKIDDNCKECCNGETPSGVSLVHYEHGPWHGGYWSPVNTLNGESVEVQGGGAPSAYTTTNVLHQVSDSGNYFVVFQGEVIFTGTIDSGVAFYVNNELLRIEPGMQLNCTLGDNELRFPITIREDNLSLSSGDIIGVCVKNDDAKFYNWSFSLYKI